MSQMTLVADVHLSRELFIGLLWGDPKVAPHLKGWTAPGLSVTASVAALAVRSVIHSVGLNVLSSSRR